MKFDIVWIQEPRIWKKRAKVSSRRYSFYNPEKFTKSNNRDLRGWITLENQANKEKYIMEDRDDLSKSPDIQVFNMYEEKKKTKTERKYLYRIGRKNKNG
jgi:hypothetical protein